MWQLMCEGEKVTATGGTWNQTLSRLNFKQHAETRRQHGFEMNICIWIQNCILQTVNVWLNPGNACYMSADNVTCVWLVET